jgi:hypothetical protein
MKKIGDRIAEPHFHEMVNGRKVVFLYSSSVPCSLRWILDGKFSAHFLGQKTAGNATKTEDEREEAQHETNNSQMGWAPFISISPTKWANFFFAVATIFPTVFIHLTTHQNSWRISLPAACSHGISQSY